MPHIVVEYSDNVQKSVESSGVVAALHAVVTDSGLFSPQAVKARSMAFSDVVLPEGAQNFLHVTVAILDGRTEVERKQLSQAVFDRAKELVAGVDRLSVDIREMSAATYTK